MEYQVINKKEKAYQMIHQFPKQDKFIIDVLLSKGELRSMETEKIINDIEKLDFISQVCLTDIIINIQPCSEEKMKFAKELIRDFDDKHMEVIKDVIGILTRFENVGGISGREVLMLKEYAEQRSHFDTVQ